MKKQLSLVLIAIVTTFLLALMCGNVNGYTVQAQEGDNQDSLD